MPKKTTTTVSLNANGQYQTTIPKGLAQAMDLAGAQLEWSVASATRLEASIVASGNDE